MRSSKPSLQRVADLAGVSASTVDRVFNGRESVSDARYRKVIAAAKQLGVQRTLPYPFRGELHFDFVHIDGDNRGESRLLWKEISGAASAGTPARFHLHTWSPADFRGLRKFFIRPSHRRHGLLICAPDLAEVREAILCTDTDRFPVVIAGSQIGGVGHIPFIGPDDYAAGQCAAHLMGTCLRDSGRILVLTGSLSHASQRSRIQGFLSVLSQEFQHLLVDGPHYVANDYQATSIQIRDSARPDMPVTGIYSTGFDVRGIELGIRQFMATAPVWIAHGCASEHAELVESGRISILVDHDVIGQARTVVKHLFHSNGDASQSPALRPAFRLFTKHSLSQHL